MPSRFSITVVAIVLLASVVAAAAQPEKKPVTIGVLSGQSREWVRASLEAFRQGLNELGWEEGRNLGIEERFSDGDVARLPALADELVRRRVDVILASTSVATRAAKKATKTIPIVMVDVGDPVGTKLVTNLARPGGNVTGVSNMVLGLMQKRLAILKEAIPGATRIAMLSHPENLIAPPQWRDAEGAARQLGLRLQRLEIRTRDDLRRAFQAAVKARADAVGPLADSFTTVLTRDILDLAARHRLPTMMETREQVEAGALLSYHPDRRDSWRRATAHVDRILKGAKPGDLPVEQPTNFQLVINLKTAKALGLTIPPAVLLQANAVIE